MPRIDDYIQARELGIKALAEKDPGSIANYAGALIREDGKGERYLTIHFIGREILITWPDMEFSYKDTTDDIPIQQQVLMLHYLQGSLDSNSARLTGEWISFQDIPDGRFYMDAFIRRAKEPLIKAFGHKAKQMTEIASETLHAIPSDYGDYSVIVKAFPLVPMMLVLWEGDEEFPPEGNILFDKNISEILSAEDIAWLAGMVVYPLAGKSKS
jgi:hypothetical protein